MTPFFPLHNGSNFPTTGIKAISFMLHIIQMRNKSSLEWKFWIVSIIPLCIGTDFPTTGIKAISFLLDAIKLWNHDELRVWLIFLVLKFCFSYKRALIGFKSTSFRNKSDWLENFWCAENLKKLFISSLFEKYFLVPPINW